MHADQRHRVVFIVCSRSAEIFSAAGFISTLIVFPASAYFANSQQCQAEAQAALSEMHVRNKATQAEHCEYEPLSPQWHYCMDVKKPALFRAFDEASRHLEAVREECFRLEAKERQELAQQERRLQEADQAR